MDGIVPTSEGRALRASEPLEAMRLAEIDVHQAAHQARSGMRPLARESARRALQAAEDRFVAARLLVWADVLKTN